MLTKNKEIGDELFNRGVHTELKFLRQTTGPEATQSISSISVGRLNYPFIHPTSLKKNCVQKFNIYSLFYYKLVGSV